MTDTTTQRPNTLAQAEGEPWHRIELQRTARGWHWSLETFASFDATKPTITDGFAPCRTAALAAAEAEAEIAEPGRALRLARSATARAARKGRTRYEIEGDDGIYRPLEQIGRVWRATMAPGTMGEWRSLRDARADHAVRLVRSDAGA